MMAMAVEDFVTWVSLNHVFVFHFNTYGPSHLRSKIINDLLLAYIS